MKIDTRLNKDLELYFRIRNNWCHSEEGEYSRQNGNWPTDFNAMLKRYNAVLAGQPTWPHKDYVADGVGTILGVEHIVFDSKEDYTMFLLRWL